MRFLVTAGALASIAMFVAAPAQAMEQLFVRLTPDTSRPYNGWNGLAPPDSSFVWRTLTIEADRGASIEAVKTRVQDQLGLLPDQIFLSFNGRLLGDNETLEAAGIDKESTLDLLLPVGSRSAVPEPDSWAMMVMSFVLVGWRLRQRRRFGAAAAA